MSPSPLPISIFPVAQHDIPLLAAVEGAAMQPLPFNTCFFRPGVGAERQLAFFETQLRSKFEGARTGPSSTISTADGGWRRVKTGFLKAVLDKDAGGTVRGEGGGSVGEAGSVVGFVIWTILERAGAAAANGCRKESGGAAREGTSEGVAEIIKNGLGGKNDDFPDHAPDDAKGSSDTPVVQRKEMGLPGNKLRPAEERDDDAELLNPAAAEWTEHAHALRWRVTQGRGRHMYLDKMYVTPAAQRRGVASRLWAAGPGRELVGGGVDGSEGGIFPIDGERRVRLAATVAVGASRLFYQSLGFEMMDSYVIDLEAAAGVEGAGFGEFWFSGLLRDHDV
ncbi:MAG: hypothetical protein LQ340_006036 [Diploschistes diacapsis]|nr:MAG: hypothetical protein LQ340_006036 [Diploschistes diacapsis]